MCILRYGKTHTKEKAKRGGGKELGGVGHIALPWVSSESKKKERVTNGSKDCNDGRLGARFRGEKRRGKRKKRDENGVPTLTIAEATALDHDNRNKPQKRKGARQKLQP